MFESVLYFLLYAKNSNLLESMEYIKEKNILVQLKVADILCVTISLLIFSCTRKFRVDIGLKLI